MESPKENNAACPDQREVITQTLDTVVKLLGAARAQLLAGTGDPSAALTNAAALLHQARWATRTDDPGDETALDHLRRTVIREAGEWSVHRAISTLDYGADIISLRDTRAYEPAMDRARTLLQRLTREGILVWDADDGQRWISTTGADEIMR